MCEYHIKLDDHRENNQKKILVVEDEPAIAMLFCKLLRNEHYAVDVSHDGLIAVMMVSNTEYHAISLDIDVPGLNGMEIYRIVRETNKHVPIIFVSGNFQDEATLNDVIQNDPKADRLAKPVNITEYVNKINEWLK